MLYRVLAACLLVPAARAAGAVHVVAQSPGPGVGFTSIGAAVAAAHDGDTILVGSGTYPAFAVNGRSLAISAADGASVVVAGGVFVLGLPESGFLSLQGLQLQADEFSAGLNIVNDAGPVWVQGCTLRGCDSELLSIFAPGTPALHASNAGSLVLTGCTLQGGSSLAGEPALACESSTLHLFGCALSGGAGQCEDAPSTFCGAAGPALRVQGGFVTAQSSTLTGGASAAGQLACPDCPCRQIAEGGAAIEMSGGGPVVELYDVTLQPGPGTPPCGSSGDMLAGASNGTLSEAQGPAFAIAGGAPVHEKEAGTLLATGKPGDQAWLLLSLHPTDTWQPADHGPLLAKDPLALPLGHVSAAGSLSITLRAPPLPPGTEGVPVVLQGLRLSSAGVLLANPLRPVVLAAGL